MKKHLLLTAIFGLLLFLAGCNGDTENDSESTEESSEEETEETSDETAEDAEGESNGESTLSGDELIDEVQQSWADTDSYELNQIFMITSDEEANSIRTITTHSDQNELKVGINSNDITTTHYIIDGEHYIYRDDELELQQEQMNMENTTYNDLISQLDDYRSGEVSQTEEGYTLNVQLENQEDVSSFLTDEVSSILEEADSVSGEITLTFDSEYKYTGGELTSVMTSDGEEFELSSTIAIENIGNIPVIEKPSGM